MNTVRSIKLLLVGSHSLIRDGIKARLEQYQHIGIIGEVEGSGDAIKLAAKVLPDIILMDISLLGMSGMGIIKRIHSELPYSKILVFSMHANREFIMEALESGAKGCIVNDVSERDMIEAIETVCKGGFYYNANVAHALLDDHLKKPLECNVNPVLTRREKTVLSLVAEGLSSRAIADKLEISPRTIETHRCRIKKRLGFQSSAEMIKYALENRIVYQAI